jgi:trehalose/maltose transport system permease protein
MSKPIALRPPLPLKLLVVGFLTVWTVVALFPLAWTALMSFKLPVDAFSANPLTVLTGPSTLASSGGLGVADLVVGLLALTACYRGTARVTSYLAHIVGWRSAGRALAAVVTVGIAGLLLVFVLPPLLRAVDAGLATIPSAALLGRPVIGFTMEHYRAVWIDHGFYRNFENSLLVSAGVVCISLSVGTLAGYALARMRSNLAFSLLILALIFRALPYSVLVSGYLPLFIGSSKILQPLWDSPGLGAVLHLVSAAPPTLYGKPWAVIAVLVSINQPFTIWMLRSFFANIPAELDEAARVDGCSHFGAFRRVIIPVMWPGVITTGLFSFLLAYNDYLVCALLLDAQSQTMVPAITQFFNRETTATDQIDAVAAAVSITAPLFLLVMGFQKQIVSGLTAGAVKG